MDYLTILKTFRQGDRELRPLRVEDLAGHLDLDRKSAVIWTVKLWRSMLIQPVSWRPPGIMWRPAPHEDITRIEGFKVTKRGRERLKWARRRAGSGTELFG